MDASTPRDLHADDAGHARAARAPLAYATSIGVMIAGAAFIAFAMSRAPQPVVSETVSTPEQRVVFAIERPETMAPASAAAPVDAAPVPVEKLADASPAAPVEAPSQQDGLTPRLSPSRLAAADKGADAAPAPGEIAPRLKPSGSSSGPSVMTLGEPFLASADDAPAPFFFEADIAQEASPRPPLAVALAGDVNDAPHHFTVRLEKGETFVDAMRRAGVRAEDRNAAAYALGKHQNLRALLPGQEFVLTTSEANQTLFQQVANDHDPQAFLLSLDYRPDAQSEISLKRHGDGFDADKRAIELTTRLMSMNGRIGGSLFMSAKHAGAPDLVIADFANIFAYDVDFQREIFGGDEFEAIFEVRYDEDGSLVDAGDILFARLKWRGRTKEKSYYRFASNDGGARADYFDYSGESAKRLLMKTPIDGARLSSGFGTRKHPILGYAKAHKGVDFAAPRGTPVKAAGDGVVERASPYGSFGNYVKIRHANGYETAYAHLNGFAKGMRAGKRVDQGDIIAYVGTTGRSTGPHLHYEVHYKGQAVNPQKLKIATGVSLTGSDLARFKAERDRIDSMRKPAIVEPPSLLAQDGEKSAAL
ncbi:MAG TPA: peptidoglycan DD-metalloendopeptidase family protein [Amphiplicatus sp.]|nr:peptidoglycan DD-metalloendopeptidase family protein [Amphiplicatus sp.]